MLLKYLDAHSLNCLTTTVFCGIDGDGLLLSLHIAKQKRINSHFPEEFSFPTLFFVNYDIEALFV